VTRCSQPVQIRSTAEKLGFKIYKTADVHSLSKIPNLTVEELMSLIDSDYEDDTGKGPCEACMPVQSWHYADSPQLPRRIKQCPPVRSAAELLRLADLPSFTPKPFPQMLEACAARIRVARDRVWTAHPDRVRLTTRPGGHADHSETRFPVGRVVGHG
jgi:hypothetical protein